MCFSVLRITFKDAQKEMIETKDAEDERIRIEEIKGRVQVIKIRVLRSVRTIEKAEFWDDSSDHAEPGRMVDIPNNSVTTHRRRA